jgi:predicted Zn-dependent protease
MRNTPFAKRTLNAVLLIGLIAGCTTVSRKPLQPGVAGYPAPAGLNFYSPQQEVQLGHQVAAQADAQLPELPADSEISRYVSNLGQKLARQLPPNPYQFNFKVVNEKDINAFALPGGPVRVNLGTIQSADNEAQLAGVMAHEIAHVYMRHSTRNASKEALASIPLQIAGAALGNGIGGQLARMGIQFGAGSVFLKYSRDAESEADRVGAKIMYEAGYDPRAMAQFFEKLEGETGKGGPQFLSDHPNPGNRATAVLDEISQLPPKNFIKDTPEFEHIKQLALQMHPYTAEQVAQMQKQRRPQQQLIGGETLQPGGSWQMLNAGAFALQYPANWQVYQNGQASVLIAPPSGVSQNAIAYGVLAGGYAAASQQQSLEQATEQILSALQRSNPGMRAAGNAERTNLNGAPAIRVDLMGESPVNDANGQPLPERDVLVTAQRGDGNVIWMLFIAPQPQFDALRPTFQQMINSLQMG